MANLTITIARFEGLKLIVNVVNSDTVMVAVDKLDEFGMYKWTVTMQLGDKIFRSSAFNCHNSMHGGEVKAKVRAPTKALDPGEQTEIVLDLEKFVLDGAVTTGQYQVNVKYYQYNLIANLTIN